MAAYLTFLLNLGAEGKNRVIDGTVAFQPDPKRIPKSAFVWKVVCDANGFVTVRGLHDGKLRTLATARWDGTLDDRKQRDTTPTEFQWELLQTALEHASALRKGDPSPYDNSLIDELTAEESRALGHPPESLPGAQYGGKHRGSLDHLSGPAAKTSRALVAAILVGSLALVLVGVLFFRLTRKDRPATSAPVATVPAPAPAPAPPVPPPPPKPAGPSTLDEAIAKTPSLEPAKLARYPVRWTDVDVASQTTLARVEKDPVAEKGKRVCIDGTVERITKTQVAGRTHHTGALVTADGDRVVFLVGGSTGELLKRDAARLCGVVTGTVDGDTELFGMFDLPDNRNPVVERP